jgi:hypothetical protein
MFSFLGAFQPRICLFRHVHKTTEENHETLVVGIECITENEYVRGCILKFPDWAAWSDNCKWCSCIAILWVILVSFAAIALCVASQRVIRKVSVSLSTQPGNFWIHPVKYNLRVLVEIMYGNANLKWPKVMVKLLVIFCGETWDTGWLLHVGKLPWRCRMNSWREVTENRMELWTYRSRTKIWAKKTLYRGLWCQYRRYVNIW